MTASLWIFWSTIFGITQKSKGSISAPFFSFFFHENCHSLRAVRANWTELKPLVLSWDPNKSLFQSVQRPEIDLVVRDLAYHVIGLKTQSLGHSHKIFIMSTEFDKNISDWRYDCTDHKNEFDFFIRLVKRPKIAVKKCQNLIFKVNFQRQKSFESF